jgi:hypothetical protein
MPWAVPQTWSSSSANAIGANIRETKAVSGSDEEVNILTEVRFPGLQIPFCHKPVSRAFLQLQAEIADCIAQ